MKKKYLGLSLILASAFALTLSSCGSKKDNNKGNTNDDNGNVIDDETENVTYTNHQFSSGVLNVGIANNKVKSFALMNDEYNLFIPVYDGDKVSFVKHYEFTNRSSYFYAMYSEIDLGNINERYSFYYDGDDFVFAENMHMTIELYRPYLITNSGLLNRVKISANGEITELLTADNDNKTNDWDFNITDNIITMDKKGMSYTVRHQYILEDAYNFGYYFTIGEDATQFHLKKNSHGDLVYYVGKTDPTADSTLSSRYSALISPTHIIIETNNGNISSETTFAGSSKLDTIDFEFKDNRIKKQELISEVSGNYQYDYTYSEADSKLFELKLTNKSASSVNPKYYYYRYNDRGFISEVEEINEYEQSSRYDILEYDENYLITKDADYSDSMYDYEYEYDNLYRRTSKKKYCYMNTGSGYIRFLNNWNGYMYDDIGQTGNYTVAFNSSGNVQGGVKVINFYDSNRESIGQNVFTPSGTIDDFKWIESSYFKQEVNGLVTTSTSRSFSAGVMTSETIGVTTRNESGVVVSRVSTKTNYTPDPSAESGYSPTGQAVTNTQLVSGKDYHQTYKEDDKLVYEADITYNDNDLVAVWIETDYEDDGITVKKEFKEEYSYVGDSYFDRETTCRCYELVAGEYVLTEVNIKDYYNEVTEKYENGKIKTKEIIHLNAQDLKPDLHDFIEYIYSGDTRTGYYYHVQDDETKKVYQQEQSDLAADGRVILSNIFKYDDQGFIESTPSEVIEFIYDKDNVLIQEAHTTVEKIGSQKKLTTITTDSKTQQKIREVLRIENYDNSSFDNLLAAAEYEIVGDKQTLIYQYNSNTGYETYYVNELIENGNYVTRHQKATVKNYSNHEMIQVNETYTEYKTVDGKDTAVAVRNIYEEYNNGLLVYKEDYRKDADTDEDYYGWYYNYTYNSDGKVTSEKRTDDIHDNIYEDSYQYTDEGKTVTIIYSVNSKMSKKYIRKYSNDGKLLTEETYYYNNSSWSLNCTVTYEYNEDGKLAKFTEQYISDTFITTYTYDEDGMLIKTSRKNGNIVEETVIYDENGKVSREDINRTYEDSVLTREITVRINYIKFLGEDDYFEYVQEMKNYTGDNLTRTVNDYYSRTFNTSMSINMKVTDSYNVRIDGVLMPGYTSHMERYYKSAGDSDIPTSELTIIKDENGEIARQTIISYDYEDNILVKVSKLIATYSNKSATILDLQELNYNTDGTIESGTRTVNDFEKGTMTSYVYDVDADEWVTDDPTPEPEEHL